MKHPDESLLLAYTRQQPTTEWPGGVYQHVANCPLCCKRCTDYIRIGATLESWAHSQAYVGGYPSLVGRVMQRAQEPKKTVAQRLAIHIFGAPSLRAISLPVAILLVFLCSTVLFVLAYEYGNLSNNPFIPSSNHIKLSTPVRIPTLPSQGVTPIAGSNGTQAQTPLLSVCMTRNDTTKWRLRICGSHFIPGTQVRLEVVVPGRAPRMHHPIKVAADGTIQDSFSISSCDNVPSYITAFDADRTEVSQVLYGISFEDCASSTP